MMNKTFLWIAISIVFLGIVCVIMLVPFGTTHGVEYQSEVGTNPSETDVYKVNLKEFDISEYQWEIENFPSTENVGQINDALAAIESAKELWIEKFSTIGGQPYDPINEREIEIFLDRDDDCWLIRVLLPPETLGSTPHAIIQKDGDVVAVWMG